MTSLRLFRFIGWFCISIAFLLTLLRTLLPLYVPSPESFNALLQSKLPYPITTESTGFSWEGFYPVMVLSQVRIKQSQHAEQSIHIDKLKLVLSIRHLLFGSVQLREAVLEGADLTLDYHINDKIALHQIPEVYYDFNSPAEMIPIDRFQLINSRIQIIRDDKKLLLKDVNLKAKINSHIKVSIHAQVVGEKGAAIDARFNAPLVGDAPIKAYMHWVGDELQAITTLHPLKLPFSKVSAHANLKTWLTIKGDDFQVNTDATFTNLTLKTHQEKILSFDKIGGLFHIKHHHKNWELIAERAFSNEVRHIAFALNNKTCDKAICWQIKARHLPLKPITDLANLFTNKIVPIETKGDIKYLNMMLDEKMKPMDVEITFSDIGIFKPKEGGIAGMTGALVYRNGAGTLHFDNSCFNIHRTDWFSQVIPLSNVNANIQWSHENDSIHIIADEVAANLGNTPIQGSFVAHFNEGFKKQPHVEMRLDIGAMQTSVALNLLPITMDLDLLEWLNQAITSGEVEQTSVVLRGNLADFPFDKQEGAFEVHTQLNHTDFDYTPGWPALSDMKASLLFRNRTLYIKADHALIQDGEVLHAEAVIPDLLNPLPTVRIDTKIKSTLENGLKIIQKSPLKETLGNELAALTLQGEMGLSLGLDIPLSAESQDDVKVRGVIALQDSIVGVPEWNIEIPHVTGEVTFTENGVKAEKLAGYLFNSPAEFHVNSMLIPEGSELKVSASGKIVSDRLLNWLKAPDLKQLSGDTDYQAEIIITTLGHAKQVDLNLNSSLVGLTIDAPLPLAKQANEPKPSECKIHFDPNDLVRVSFKYGDSLNIAFSTLRQEAVWRPIGGHIHFGENRLAKHREDGILLLDGDLAELNVEQWQQFSNQINIGLSDNKASLELLVELNIASLKLLGENFTQTALKANSESNIKNWNILFDGPALKGKITLPEDESKEILVDLQTLSLTTDSEISNLWENQEQTQKKQSIDIKINDMNIDRKKLSDVQVRLVPTAKGYDFNTIKAKVKEATIDLTGEWNYLLDKKVIIRGKVVTRNIGNTLLALGKEGTLKGANGSLEFNIEWEGTPAKIDYLSLTGNANLSLRQGYVQGVNPGIGRILSLLNLDNVKRRLKLEFGDVTKNSFAFDELTAKFQFGKGTVSSNKIILNGPSAKIEAFGQANLINQGLSGEMVVMPDVTGSLPVAAAIAAGNPAVGAAVWVADKMFGNKIQSISRFRYQILGTWDAPQVKELPITTKTIRG